ncbi:Dot/Icm T4SS effector AnkK/LegA5 [Legionella fallonii]|uniref:Substrate of the Dot/Icm secretion system [ankyrin repeat][coiled coil domain] n=1 Tax=Legionella fallonii LLAP-10 TaxID=1212491 RepID=A0A098G5D3_9GAMM|nr:substrate of the Dot/Icm secretion system [ankyrin repeat][coiled coil domain] [Legionella fallonii LLAP-10]
MVWQYNIGDIKLGKPTYLGHEAYIDAVYSPADQNARPSKVIFKKNKYGKARNSRFEVAFSQLARLFLADGTTSHQKLVVNNSGRVVGVATEHLCYVIGRKEGLNGTFLTLDDPTKNCDCSVKQVLQAEDIPYYFFDQLPHGFFANLLQAEKDNQLDIDYASLASILASSYTLEEDDLHKGNFGFYIVKKNGKPRVVFFKIDHDLMLADSIMSFKTLRPFHIFHGADAFDITAEDLLTFPNLASSFNVYWPTRLSFIYKPWDNKAYLDSQETEAFSLLAERPEFKKAKWLAFYKHILLSKEIMDEALGECLDNLVPHDRARIALLTDATVARQARLKAVLFSIKEFRDCIASLTPEEHTSLQYELLVSTSELEIPTQIIESMFSYQELCQSPHAFDDGDTPLHAAIKLGDYRYEETMQMFGHFINVKNNAGKTPLDVAMDMAATAKKHPVDIRADVRFTMQHLLANGAEKNERFEWFNQEEHIESYKFHTLYISSSVRARTYQELKSVLQDIGEDHRFCLKFKKNLAIECINHFIKANRNHPDMQPILQQLKKDMNGESSKDECAPLLYIRQLRSRLWIIRLIRGLYGSTSTQSEINELVDNELERINSKESNSFSSFHTANDADENERKIKEAKVAKELAAEEQAIREQITKEAMNEVDELLCQIGQSKHVQEPNFSDFRDIAKGLHKTLTKIRNEYEIYLKTDESSGRTTGPEEAWILFCTQWQSAIEAYKVTHANLVQRLQQPLKKAAEEAVSIARAKRTGAIIEKIDMILEELKNKVDGIGSNHSEAKDVAKNLHAMLLEARDDYFVQLVNGRENGETIDADKAGQRFKKRCRLAIDAAMPVLEKDLGWGGYLKNILKAIVNAVIYVVTVGHVNSFFTYSKSDASKAATVADEELQYAEQASFFTPKP